MHVCIIVDMNELWHMWIYICIRIYIYIYIYMYICERCSIWRSQHTCDNIHVQPIAFWVSFLQSRISIDNLVLHVSDATWHIHIEHHSRIYIYIHIYILYIYCLWCHCFNMNESIHIHTWVRSLMTMYIYVYMAMYIYVYMAIYIYVHMDMYIYVASETSCVCVHGMPHDSFILNSRSSSLHLLSLMPYPVENRDQGHWDWRLRFNTTPNAIDCIYIYIYMSGWCSIRISHDTCMN